MTQQMLLLNLQLQSQELRLPHFSYRLTPSLHWTEMSKDKSWLCFLVSEVQRLFEVVPQLALGYHTVPITPSPREPHVAPGTISAASNST
jgi:hypothetical protein